MSSDLDKSEPPSPPPPPQKEDVSPPPRTTVPIKDVLLWKKKKRLNIAAIVISTAIWVALQIYGFNFITVVSWLAMFMVSSLFIWGNIDRLLGREPPEMSRICISEESAVKMANVFRQCVDQSFRFMLHLGVESKWHVFAGAMVSLWLLSVIGSKLDFITFLYLGELVGLTVPVLCNKYEHKIKESGQRIEVHYQRYYSMVLQKVSDLKMMILQKTGDLKNKVSNQKEKKME